MTVHIEEVSLLVVSPKGWLARLGVAASCVALNRLWEDSAVLSLVVIKQVFFLFYQLPASILALSGQLCPNFLEREVDVFFNIAMAVYSSSIALAGCTELNLDGSTRHVS